MRWQVRADRPYGCRGLYGGAGVAYAPPWTYADGGDLFSFPTITTNFNNKHPICGFARIPAVCGGPARCDGGPVQRIRYSEPWVLRRDRAFHNGTRNTK